MVDAIRPLEKEGFYPDYVLWVSPKPPEIYTFSPLQQPRYDFRSGKLVGNTPYRSPVGSPSTSSSSSSTATAPLSSAAVPPVKQAAGSLSLGEAREKQAGKERVDIRGKPYPLDLPWVLFGVGITNPPKLKFDSTAPYLRSSGELVQTDF